MKATLVEISHYQSKMNQFILKLKQIEPVLKFTRSKFEPIT
jgi:hypothetical protein